MEVLLHGALWRSDQTRLWLVESAVRRPQLRGAVVFPDHSWTLSGNSVQQLNVDLHAATNGATNFQAIIGHNESHSSYDEYQYFANRITQLLLVR